MFLIFGYVVAQYKSTGGYYSRLQSYSIERLYSEVHDK